ncbi:hypothetical protein B0H19DRAFT_1245597 [Mycena capillaripes]|nr:hypothetical protein B0H19DRAFT_1245597 [Mycena capillaripes]
MPHPQHRELDRRNSAIWDNGRSPILSERESEKYLRTHVQHSLQPASSELPWNFDAPRNPPSLAPAVMLQPTLPSPEVPNLPSDWWHSDTNLEIVNGTGDLWSGDRVPFFPDHGRCTTGISMKQARLAIGMLHSHTSLSEFVHPFLFNVPHPMLSIQWPGYHSVDEYLYQHDGLRPLNIKRPLHLHANVTLAQLAKQVSDYLFEFSELYGDHCNRRDPNSRLLGPGGISFNRLRLVKLWTSNHGVFWNAEVAIVDDYMQYF